MSGLAAGLADAVVAEVLVRVRALEGLATRAGRPDVERWRAEMAALTAALRRLLETHAEDVRGRCPQCRGWVRRRRWPCGVWLAAHRHVVTYGAADAASCTELVPSQRETGATTPAGCVDAPRSVPGRGPLVFSRRSGVSGRHAAGRVSPRRAPRVSSAVLVAVLLVVLTAAGLGTLVFLVPMGGPSW